MFLVLLAAKMKAIMSEICLHNSIVPVEVASSAVWSSTMEMGIHSSLEEFLGNVLVKEQISRFENQETIVAVSL